MTDDLWDLVEDWRALVEHYRGDYRELGFVEVANRLMRAVYEGGRRWVASSSYPHL